MNKDFNENLVAKTVKHGEGSLTAWGCMAASGIFNLVFIESTMKKEDYLSILQQNINPSVEKLGLRGN